MKTEYLRTARQSFMIVKEADYPFEAYELKMIQNNHISSLLDFQVMITDGRVEYWYDVTGMQSLEKQFAVEPAGAVKLQQLLRGILEMKTAMDEYLLDDDNIVFSTSMVFYDRFSEKIRFCYVPGMDRQETNGLKALFEEILQRLDYNDSLAVKLGYEMYERCAQSDFVPADCVACLRLCEEPGGEGLPDEEATDKRSHSSTESGAQAATRPGTPESPPNQKSAESAMTGLEFLPLEAARKNGHRKKRRRRNRVQYGKLLEEDREILYAAEAIHDGGFTELFSEDHLPKVWELVYKGDGMEKNIPLTEFPFYIGTDGKKTSAPLQSRTVSRVHAKVWMENGCLMLEDYNSTNGTYLNEKLLALNTPVQVNEGDRVVFATEEFLVCHRRSRG